MVRWYSDDIICANGFQMVTCQNVKVLLWIHLYLLVAYYLIVSDSQRMKRDQFGEGFEWGLPHAEPQDFTPTLYTSEIGRVHLGELSEAGAGPWRRMSLAFQSETIGRLAPKVSRGRRLVADWMRGGQAPTSFSIVCVGGLLLGNRLASTS